jgi:hypothetical protein
MDLRTISSGSNSRLWPPLRVGVRGPSSSGLEKGFAYVVDFRTEFLVSPVDMEGVTGRDE